MAAIVWGTRIKEESIGAVAFDCPACGERVIGDAFKVLKASHIYFIHGNFSECQRYVRCRLCAVSSELPKTAKPEILKHLNIISPTRDFIEKTNPALIDRPNLEENSFLANSSQKERHTFALFTGILIEIKSHRSSSKAAGNAEGIILIILMASLFLPMALYDKFLNHTSLFLISLWSIAMFLCIYFFRLQNILMFKAAHKFLNIHLQRYLEFNHVCLQDLIHQSSSLKGEYKLVKQYLSWSENRIDPTKYYTNFGY